jgi:hypothetical protein
VRVPEILTTSFPEILATWTCRVPRAQSSRTLSARNEVIDMLKRHAIQVLRGAGDTLDEIAHLSPSGREACNASSLSRA